MHNFFTLFDLPEQFNLNEKTLKTRFVALQTQFHPDNFAQQSETQKLNALKYSTLLNDAFQCLNNPIARAQHLLQLVHHPLDLHNNTAMPQSFLIQQLTLHEELEEAKKSNNINALENLFHQIDEEERQTLNQLNHAFEQQDYSLASTHLRALMFLSKLKIAVSNALEE